MLEVDIPGYKSLQLNHLIMDTTEPWPLMVSWWRGLQAADIVCLDILDGLDVLLNPMRLVATLRS